MIVFILNGAPRAGKKTFVNLLDQISELKVRAYSSIDWAKKVARKEFGWTGTKDKESRQLLSDIKELGIIHGDIPFKKVTQRIEIELSNHTNYFCTDIREPSEISKVKYWCEMERIPCYSILIRNPAAERAAIENGFLSRGDTQYLECNYDFSVLNDGGIDDLQPKVEAMLFK